jgi:hypothetical protein
MAVGSSRLKPWINGLTADIPVSDTIAITN